MEKFVALGNWSAYLAWFCFLYLIIQDIKTRQLSNLVILTIVALFFIFFRLENNESLASITTPVTYGLIAFTFFLCFYAINAVGAGDVKMAFATALWLTPENITLSLAVFSSALLTTALTCKFLEATTKQPRTVPVGVALGLTGWAAIISKQNLAI